MLERVRFRNQIYLLTNDKFETGVGYTIFCAIEDSVFFWKNILNNNLGRLSAWASNFEINCPFMK